MEMGIPKAAKIENLQCLCNNSKKEVRDHVDLLQADKHQSFPKLVSTL